QFAKTDIKHGLHLLFIVALRVFCFSLFLFDISLLISNRFCSKISVLTGFVLLWLIIAHSFFKAFDRCTKIGTDGAELFGAKKQYNDDGNNQQLPNTDTTHTCSSVVDDELIKPHYTLHGPP